MFVTTGDLKQSDFLLLCVSAPGSDPVLRLVSILVQINWDKAKILMSGPPRNLPLISSSLWFYKSGPPPTVQQHLNRQCVSVEYIQAVWD